MKGCTRKILTEMYQIIYTVQHGPMHPHVTPSKTLETKQLTLKHMDRTQKIKEAHPWLRYNEAFKVLLYHHQGSMCIHKLQRDKLERSMEAFAKLLKSKSRKALKPFVE